MTVSYTPHPDDEQMLLKIRRYLIGFRITNGWTQEQLSQKINNTKHSVETLEKGGFDWHITRLQQWPIPFGLRLHAAPIFEPAIHDAVNSHDEVNTLYELWQLGSANWPRWQRAYLTAYLKTAREVQSISRTELGARMGITAGAVSTWEINADNVRLLRLLNHARALGGRIILLEVT